MPPLSSASAPADDDGPVVFFDGACNLCDASVLFVIDRDPRAHFRFAPLQGPTARARLGDLAPAAGAAPDSIVLVEGGRRYERSAAALRIARRLGPPWSLLWAGVLVPRPLRDALYRLVARHRYRWFGRAERCRVPSPELRARFLD